MEGTIRRIIHLDLDAFFCAVEELRDPALSGKAFAVGGRPDERGVVASCSYAARRFGVRSAMPMSRALRLCPGLVIIHSHYSDYSQYSRQVMERMRSVSPLVEQISIDEAFMDVSELGTPAEEIARRLQQEIQSELKLPCSLGVAGNKLVAKIATEVGKARGKGERPPSALVVVPPGSEAEFLAPLPVQMLWGVGPKTAERLEEMGIHTIGELAARPEKELMSRFGKNGYDLSCHARGIDNSPIVTQHEAKSISQETTFARDVRNLDELQKTLAEQAAQVAQHLQKNGLTGRVVKLKLRWPDFTTLTRQTTLTNPTQDANEIFTTAQTLFQKVWKPGKAVRLIGVGVSHIEDRPRQLSLWDQVPERALRLKAALE